MHVYVFNACLLIGWMLALIGGVMLNPGAGLVVAGVLLVALALLGVRLSGGLYVPPKAD